jgi:hypothetical protein
MHMFLTKLAFEYNRLNAPLIQPIKNPGVTKLKEEGKNRYSDNKFIGPRWDEPATLHELKTDSKYKNLYQNLYQNLYH